MRDVQGSLSSRWKVRYMCVRIFNQQEQFTSSSTSTNVQLTVTDWTTNLIFSEMSSFPWKACLPHTRIRIRIHTLTFQSGSNIPSHRRYDFSRSMFSMVIRLRNILRFPSTRGGNYITEQTRRETKIIAILYAMIASFDTRVSYSLSRKRKSNIQG